MKRVVLAVLMSLTTAIGFAQTNGSSNVNIAQRILDSGQNQKITIGGYAEIDYNQPEGANGNMDIHRFVLMLGYKFNDKTQFITEIEYEHVKEVYIEQAFVNYNISDNVSLRGGLMLVPMGIVNEYHEPTTFNGVERPNVDKSIIPTTWREIGVGVNGRWDDASLKYQAYILNGFISDNGGKYLGGKNGLRNGRQKGAGSVFNNANFSAKLDYYGIQGLKLGLAAYAGRTQATDYENRNDDAFAVGVKMIGLDARYINQRFSARGQFIKTYIDGAAAYNTEYSSDLGDEMQGWYVEGAYNLLSLDNAQALTGFVRYEDYDTHHAVSGITENLAFDRKDITVGLSYMIAPGTVVKADHQWFDNAVDGNLVKKQFNLGLGVWF
ncbi:hypothetical protein ACFLSU_05850 [Bacteroidota bacterium]